VHSWIPRGLAVAAAASMAAAAVLATAPAAAQAAPSARPAANSAAAHGKAVASLTAQTVSPAIKPAKKQPAGARPATQRQGAGVRAATACVRGTWNYIDQFGSTRPAASWWVEVWDQDAFFADTLLASGRVGWGGEYELCFDNFDMGGANGQDVVVKFIAHGGAWVVQDRFASWYSWASVRFDDIPDGTTRDLGAMRPDGLMGAARAFGVAFRAWNATPGNCWDDTGSCQLVVLAWDSRPQPVNAAFIGDHSAGPIIRLWGPATDHESLVARMIGLAVLSDNYDGAPGPLMCEVRREKRETNNKCAWTSGFALWYSSMVLGSPVYTDDRITVDLEGQAPTTPGWTNGDTVEGRVAGALWDLYDSAGDGTDHYGEGKAAIWQTIQSFASATFAEFWNHRRLGGFSTSNAPLGSLHQNSIDYGFRP
jgi:hypothetical protein